MKEGGKDKKSFFSFGKKSDADKPRAKAGRWENFTSLAGSKDWINCLHYSDDASLIVAGTRAGSIHLWRSPSMGPLAGEWKNDVQPVLKAHSGDEFNTGIINAVSLYDNNTRLISGSSDWEVKVWDVETSRGVCEGVAVGSTGSRHSAAIRDIAVSDVQSSLFATASNDGCVLVWDSRVREAGSSAVASMKVSEKPVSGCMFEPVGLNGGGNWIITSDETGKISVYDLRKWELSRVVYDSTVVRGRDKTNSWEGGVRAEIFKDVQISTEGWVCAVTEPGHLYTWNPAENWEMTKQPTVVKATCLTTSRVTR
jgi:WD40 repeat protein